MKRYIVELLEDDNGSYSAQVVNFEGATTQGCCVAEALMMLNELIAWIKDDPKEFKELPESEWVWFKDLLEE